MGNLNKVTYTDHQTVITAANLNDIQDSVIQNTSYTTCSTAAGTAAKTAALANFVLTTGSCVRVKFTNSNTAASPTLNINSTGAKALKKYGTDEFGGSSTASWRAGAVLTFVYDGTNWVQLDYPTKLDNLGIGAAKYNAWDNSVDVLNVGAHYNGGNFRINATAQSYPAGLPSEVSPATTSEPFVAYRQSFMQMESTLYHAIVVLYEVWPVPGRIWINTYNTSWKGWRTVMFTDGGTFSGDVVINDEGATTSSEVSLLTLGNSTATGTVGNSNGMIRMYGQGDKYLNIRPHTSSGTYTTANRTIMFPDADGTIMLNTGGTFVGHIYVNRSDGTASAQGYSTVIAGNSTAVGTAGNSRGQIMLYGTGTKYTAIRADSTADRTITFPDGSGTIPLFVEGATVTGGKMATLSNGQSVLTPVLPYLGIGARKDNLWSNSDSVLLLAEKFNGGTFRISTSSDSYPAGLPTVLQGTTAILYRQQFMQFESNLNHAIVVLYEVYPVGRRIWVNHYNTSWGGWKAIDTQCQNFSGVKLDAIKQTLTPSVGSAYTLYGGLYYYKIGTKVHVNVGLQGLPKTDYTVNTVGTLPTGFRPSHQISNVCAGGSGGTYAQVCVNTAGQINVYTNQQYVNGQIEFDVF